MDNININHIIDIAIPSLLGGGGAITALKFFGNAIFAQIIHTTIDDRIELKQSKEVCHTHHEYVNIRLDNIDNKLDIIYDSIINRKNN